MRKTITRPLCLLAGGTVAAFSAAGCFVNYHDDCSYNITLPCFYENAGGGGAGGAPPECIPSETNPEIADDCGVFVSPSGSDATGTGTKEKPYLTLGKAMTEGGRVYACAADAKPFEEAVEAAGEVVLYGGLDCANDWKYGAQKKSVWTAPADTVPLVVVGDVKVTVVDFVVTARDAEKAGGSSMAVLAFGQTAELVLERCDVTAGNGQEGVTPEKPAGSGMPGQAGENGEDGCVDMNGKLGGNAGLSMCDGMSQNGGLGGTGTTVDGGVGSDGQPQPGPQPTDGKGGIGQIGAGDCDPGEPGATGQNGTPGDGASGIGTLSEAGYAGVSGGDGKAKGSPGQGGGGGGGAKVCANGNAGPGGGGGGSGGCGGEPGKGGGAGGASIAIASVGATLTLSQVRITAKNGGRGGNGGDGQSGGLGGTSGKAGDNNGDTEASACDGGKGGKGGDGGGGGGGLGGHSVGIAFTGTAPVITDDVSITHAGAGPGGDGGNKTMDLAAKGGLGLTCKTLDFDDGTCVK